MRKPAGVLTSAGQQASSLRSVALHYHGSVPSRYRFSLYAPIGTAIAEIRLLGISAPQFETGAAGTGYFEPGGVFFRDCQRANLRRWLASRMRGRFLMRSASAEASVKKPAVVAAVHWPESTDGQRIRAGEETRVANGERQIEVASRGAGGSEADSAL